ncbi:MAG: CPBP family intramembrane metalloprotease [Candidatus Lokiarchaeota archaeon]|nr:CPBP family intramembrane metalloprotease [Candidatus Lokiarchaeota archaeon]
MTEKEMGLYKLAKYTNLEIVMEAQVQSSGANQARVLEKYRKNKGSIKQQAFAMKIVFAMMLLFVAILPVSTYFQVISILSDPLVIPDSILIPGSILFGSFNLMQLLYLIMLGMFAIGAMMSGDTFRWYETLPLSKKRLRKLGFMTVFRNLDVGLIVMMLAFPIIMFAISLNIILALVALMTSVINVMFSFSILVLIAGRISRVLKISEAGSKKATLIRIFTMLSYMIVIFSASFFLQWIITSAGAFFALTTSSDIPLIVNIIMSLMPYPFSSGYLITMAMEPLSFSPILWVSALIGVGLFILLTYFTYTRALRAMRTVTSSASLEAKQSLSSKKTSEKPIEVLIEPRTPIKAYIRKDLSTTTRDIQTFMFVIMPFVLPFMVLIPLLISPSGLMDSFTEDFVMVWAMVTLYQPMISMMLTSGFLNMEDSGSSILSSLPIRTRNQAKAKLLLLGSIQTLSYFLPLVLFIPNPEFLSYLFSFISYYPVVVVLLLSMFQMKLRFFGRMKYKFVVEEFNPEKKVTKWFIMVVVQYLIYFAFNFMGAILLLFFGQSIMFLGSFIGGILALGVLLLSFNSMFPKVLGKKQTISIREIFRKHTFLGTLSLLALMLGFLLLPGFVQLPLLFFVDSLPTIAILLIDFFVNFGLMMLLWLVIVPRFLGLPNGEEHLKGYIKTIGIKNDGKLIRNILLGVGCSAIAFICRFITANIFGNYFFDLDVIFGTPGSSLSFYGWFLFILMLIPGIWEEVSFRGVMMTLNMRKYSRTTVIIVVSLLFGFFHYFNLLGGSDLFATTLQVIWAALFGFLLGYLFIKTKSLIPSIILHYLVNTVGQLFVPVSFDSMINLSLFAVLGLGILPVVFGMILVKLVVKEEPR